MEDSDREQTSRSVEELTHDFVTYVLIPAWLGAGMLDWYWHRVTKIECNAGAHESITHILMTLEAGAGTTLALFCEINAGVIAALFGSALAHEATVIWDVSYAASRRPVKPREQHTHSFLEVLPFVTAAFAAFMYPEQTRALVGLGRERPRFEFRLSHAPPPLATYVAVAASGVFGVLPYIEELTRCLRVRPTLAPAPPPEK